MTPVAGANWGGHLVPRYGQEVLVAFQNGNIDRPIVIGMIRYINQRKFFDQAKHAEKEGPVGMDFPGTTR